MALVPTPGDPTNIAQPPQVQPLQNSYPQGYITPDAAKAAYDYSQALLKNSMGTVPGTKGGWTVGLQHMVEALMGGQQAYQANRGQLGSAQYGASTIPTRQTPTPDNSQGNAPSDKTSALPEGAVNIASTGGSDPMDQAAATTKKQESGGNYANVTTTINQRTGKPQSALGAYGVMDSHIGPNGDGWDREILGKVVTPQEFLKNPQMQDTIYKAKMGQYIAQYGPQGAGRAWIGGAGGVNNPQRTDPLGTQVGDYGNKFALGFNGQPSSMANAPGGQQAIALALAKGAPGATPTVAGVPAEQQMAQNGPYVAPFAVPQRPHIGEEQFRKSQSDFYLSPEQKKAAADAYYSEFQPQQVPYLGGNVIINPQNKNQQFFSPGVQWNEEKSSTGATRKVPAYVAPGPKGPIQQRIEEQSSTSPAAPGVAIPAEAPPDIKPGMLSTPPAAAPPAVVTPPPAPASPAAVAPPAASPSAPVPPTGSVGAITPPKAPIAPAPPPAAASPAPITPQQLLASNAPGGLPVAQAAAAARLPLTPPVPGTGNEMIAKAQGSLGGAPANFVPGAAPPIANATTPMGANALGALTTPSPLPAKGPQTAENFEDWDARMRKAGVDYEQRKALASADATAYTKTAQNYMDIGQKATKEIPAMALAEKMVADPRFYSGVGADWALLANKVRAALGDKAAAAPTEVFQKLMSGAALDNLKIQLGGLGQIRLAEINLMNQSMANLYNTPTANAAVLQMMQRVNKQADMISRIAASYGQGWRWGQDGKAYRSDEAPTNGGLAQAVKQYTDLNPLFTNDEIQNYGKTLNMGQPRPNPNITADRLIPQSMATDVQPTTPDATEAPPATEGVPSSSGVRKYDATGKRIQ